MREGPRRRRCSLSGVYLDASAITKLVITEPESAALRAAVDGRDLASSRVTEPHATLARLAFIELDADVATIAAATGGARLRALDAIHIASAPATK